MFGLTFKYILRVRAVMENLEKSWNLDYQFPALEKSWKYLKMSKVMENGSGKLLDCRKMNIFCDFFKV